MMRAPFAMLLVVAGCSKPAGQPSQPVATNTMANMAMSKATKFGKGTGTITSIDPATGTITLDHGPIAELGWPAMTMSFGTKAAMSKGVALGDNVDFEFVWNGSSAELTRIAKQHK